MSLYQVPGTIFYLATVQLSYGSTVNLHKDAVPLETSGFNVTIFTAFFSL
jgi:hypothetical protein